MPRNVGVLLAPDAQRALAHDWPQQVLQLPLSFLLPEAGVVLINKLIYVQ